jgi:hypothetical protein
MQFLERAYRMPGVLLKDVPRFLQAIRHSGTGLTSHRDGWIRLCNRIESLSADPHGIGVSCNWKWGSDLVACEVLPILGRLLLKTSLAEWPIEFSDCPQSPESQPKVSFIIAHSGTDRLAQLRRTIRSLFAQSDCPAEVIVVDQSEVPVLAQLPFQVRYRHLDKSRVQPGWHKAWAYNIGARIANSDILIFQDGDICVPRNYAAQVYQTLTSGGYEAASIQRLLYYLDPDSTRSIENAHSCDIPLTPERVFQNWKGGTIAVRTDAFFRIGGFDEGFVDWGGEDDEFYDRCAALKHCRFGYLPFIHLWHKPQPGRKQGDNPNIAHVMPWRMQIPIGSRIEELSARRFGNTETPDPSPCYKSGLRQMEWRQ